MDSAPALSLLVPTLNERDNVVPLAEEALAAMATPIAAGRGLEILFADSASDDGTQAAVDALAARGLPVRLLPLPREASLSAACIAALDQARAPAIAVCDADLQHDLSLLPAFLAALDAGADLVVGTRYRDGGSSSGGLRPWRRLLSRTATALTRRAVGASLSDPMSGFFALPRRQFEWARPKLSGGGFKLLLDLVLTLEGPLKIVELPYAMRPRRAGRSKLGMAALMAAARQLGAGALRRKHASRQTRRA
ncbi:MAG TPA: glycosyltransferase [Kiloniellales bacterium]|nr:glycosyltransferase [Kiloniellales bacterium]